ncbi:MAG: SCO7613 C-terminal domain-containing membrane protein [Ilumatobacteraceae bacterium]
MPCAQHSGGVVVDGCEQCALVDKAAGWVAWLEHRVDTLDDEAASIADQMAVASTTRDEIAHHIEHGTLNPQRLLELIAPFVPATAPPRADGPGRERVGHRPVSVLTGTRVPPGVTAGLERLGGPIGNGIGDADGARPGGAAAGGPREPLTGRPPTPAFAQPLHEMLHVSASVAMSAVGALLVLVAAIVFTAVSWGHLGEGGRVAVMLGFLAASTALTVVMQRRGLRWTAEAMAWLTASLAAVETIAMTVYDIVLHVDTIPVTVLCTGVAFAAWSGAMAFGTRGNGERHHLAQPWQATPVALMVAVVAWAGGLDGSTRRLWWGPLVALAAASLYAVSRRALHRPWWVWTSLVAWVVAMVLSLTSLDGSWQRLVGASLTSVVLLVAAGLNYLRRIERDSVPVGDVAASLVLFIVPAVHFRSAGERAIDIAVVVLAALALLAGWVVPRRQLDRRVAGAALMPLIGAAVVALDDASTGALALAAVAVVLLLWSRTSTVPARGVPVTVATVMGVVWCGYLARAVGLPLTWSAVVVTAVAASVAVASLRGMVPWPLGNDEAASVLPAQVVVVGVAGAAVFVTSPNMAALALASLVLSAASIGLLDHRRIRAATLPVAAGTAALSWVALLSSRHVSVVEAYTLPVSALFVVAGVLALQWWRSLNSWILAPGLVVAALPTMVVLVVDVDGLTRWLGLLVCGTAMAAMAGRLRLAAPFVVGAVAAVTGALSQLGPWAVGLPRWLSIGVAGAALLTAGARFESVRVSARRLSQLAKHLR